MQTRMARAATAVTLVLLLFAVALAASGCTDGEEPATSPQVEQTAPTSSDSAEDGEHTVPAGNAAQEAVDELNDKIEQSTTDPE